MNVHILGICGKFMSALALIAKQKGFQVTGADKNLIPSVADMLKSNEISLIAGYQQGSISANTDCVIIGNALSRGLPVIEEILNKNMPFCSGPEWLSRNVLTGKWVVAISGTHGKTTTTSMVAWILEEAGLNPSFLIGGDPGNFVHSARYTDSNFFIIEADEYDTAFFDKRSKFLHYQPKTLIINNLEFDHGDIFDDLATIKKQFSNLLRIVPSSGLVVVPSDDVNVKSVLTNGYWTPTEEFGHIDAEWHAVKTSPDGSEFNVFHRLEKVASVKWSIMGQHNISNALAAIAAARHVGVPPSLAAQALCRFKGVKRRLELRGVKNGIHVYDDFAHHPTAIAKTLSALRLKVRDERIFAVLEFGSNTMRSGYHEQHLIRAFTDADKILLLQPRDTAWQVNTLLGKFSKPAIIFDSVPDIVSYLAKECQSGDHILCMSNMRFDDIHQKLLTVFSE
jgi:UDP-N-acetylmuramate: L-alanyl-gamma-D-glutamyl-meso-diaminopimelate ligase